MTWRRSFNTPLGPTSTPRAEDWRDHAVCREEDPELFFPVGNSADAYHQADAAKAVCARCPVMEQCGRWAIRNRVEHGVWGGMSENDRRKVLKILAERNASPPPTRDTGACGTEAGAKRHRRAGEPVCRRCLDAAAAAAYRRQAQRQATS